MPIIVSDAAAEESLQAYTNPLSIQAKALDDISNKVLNGDIVSDGNNPFTFLTEFASNMTANIVTKACECFNGLYPLNAQTATELYRHLSDFDYVGLYATPATTTVELVFDRNFLIDNAVDISAEEGFNEDPTMMSGVYSKIILPAYSKFNVGDYVFGLMYPIEIRVRKAIKDNQIDYANSVITVTWDAEKKNPLMELSSHILEHRDFVQDGQMLTAIEVPIYQFEVTNHLEESIGATGFAKRYDYTGRFYAVRVFHFKNGIWNELAQTFSDTKYDPDIPTAIVKVLTDLNKVEVVVPHIYFNSTTSTTVIGKRILVKLYTTQGEINVDLSEYRVDQFQASFLMTDTNLVEDDRYSNMLKRIPTVYVLPLSTKISSGTNGLTFDQLKDRVKYNNSYTVKITPTDLQNYFNTSGYKFTKELDNITDRVYCAHKILKDGTGTPIASGQGLTYLTEDALNIQQDKADSHLYVPGYSTITVVDEHTITILPSSVFKYDEKQDRFYLLSDAEKLALDDPDIKTRVDNYNSNLYTYSPFHTVLSYESSSPIAGTYDMFKPAMKDRIFLWENDKTTVELSIYNATIVPDPDGGYILTISVFKTANISNVPARPAKSTIENFKLMLSTEGRGNLNYYMIGKYDGVDASGKDTYSFKLKSNFKISANGQVCIDSLRDGMEDADEEAHGGYVDIDYHDYVISLCILDSVLENYTETGFNKSNTIDFGLPSDLDDYTLLCRQSFKLKLGEALPLIQNNVVITTSDEQYETYQTTQFATYQTTVYDRYTIADHLENPYDVELSDIGQFKLESYTDEEGNKKKRLIAKHSPGDVILSSQYDVCYGPTMTLSIKNGDETEIDTLEMVQSDSKTVTPTSDPSNEFAEIDGDLFVQSKSHPDLTGVYKLENRLTTGSDRVWKHQFVELCELFDESILETNPINRINTGGVISYEISDTMPEEFQPTSDGEDGRYDLATSSFLRDAEMLNASDFQSMSTTALDTFISRALDASICIFRNIIYRWRADGTHGIEEASTDAVSYLSLGDQFIKISQGIANRYPNATTETRLVSKPGIKLYEFFKKMFALPQIATRSGVFGDSYIRAITTKVNRLKKESQFSSIATLATYAEAWENNPQYTDEDKYIIYNVYKQWRVDIEPGASTEAPISISKCNFYSSNNPVVAETIKESPEIISAREKLQQAVDEGKPAAKAKLESFNRAVDALDWDGIGNIGGVYFLREVNTQARDYDRKYFFIGDSADSFDFVNNTGFVIEYGYSGTTSSGVKMSWVLNYYYQDIDENGDATLQCETVAENLDDINSPLGQSISILEKDPYVKDYLTKYHVIDYRTIDDVVWLYLDELYSARCVFTEGSYGVITRKDPWDVIWKSNDPDVEDIPVVTCLVNTPRSYRVYVEDAFKFIDEHIYPSTCGSFKLYRNIENVEEQALYEQFKTYMSRNEDTQGWLDFSEAIANGDLDYANSLVMSSGMSVDSEDSLVEILGDRLSKYMFVAVIHCDDDRPVNEYNYIDYAPGYGDSLGVSDVEIGTTTAVGAIYYRDVEMTNYNPESDGLFPEDIVKIFRLWKSLKTQDYSDSQIYDQIISTYGSGKDKISVPLTHTLLRKIISSSTSSYMSPWIKLTTCSSREAISDYVQARMNPYNELVGDLAGYIGVIETFGDNPYDESTIEYISLLSEFPRTIKQKDVNREETAFYVNPDNLTWNEIDKWPWEYTTPWINMKTFKKDDVTIQYNAVISSSQVLFGPDTVKLDENGNPIVATPRAMNYGVEMIHCDYKLSLSEDAEYSTYMEDVRELLRSYFNELKAITPTLLARTKLYFSPIRTFGHAEFKGSNGSIQTLPVQFSAELGLHIEAYVKDSNTSKQTIREVILTLIDKDMKDGTINLAELAKDITKELSDNVLYVDVLGLNGNKSQQTMIPVDEGTYPQLKQILVLYEDGTIHVDRDLELDWYVIT